MKVERKRWDDVTIMTFVGEFDAFNLPTFSEKIDGRVEAGDHKMVFNLRLLTFINSSALGYLLKVKKRCQELEGDLVLVQPSKFIKKTLLTLGLQEVFNIYESDEDGVLSFNAGGGAEEMKLGDDNAARDEKIAGANAIMFRVVDEEGNDLYGSNPQVGRITELADGNLTFRWDIPSPGPRHLVPISSENFDAAIHPGTRMRAKFRQPFAMKSHYFELGGLVSTVDKGEETDGKTEAHVTFEYQDVSDEDGEALSAFVADLAKFREALGGAGEQV
ncbi:MAG: STAS domain-containing protein [Planctomycetota bacterium]|jgi:anti-sigma B factor antagonist